MKTRNRFGLSVGAVAIALMLAAILPTSRPAAKCQAEIEDYKEAMQQTEDEWKALRTSMTEGSAKLKGMVEEYQKYEDIVFSQDMERGIQLATKLFSLSDSQRDEAKKRLSDLREMFNTLDANGAKTKLTAVAEKLEFADKVAGEVTNVFEYAKKFDPSHAKDNPTYGLRLIGNIITEGASKIEAVPLVGQVLGKWLKAYGEVAGDFANALDRLAKKIEEFRQGSLCGQLGYQTDEQAAFEEASKANGEPCQQYFPTGALSRLRGKAYEGNSMYFLFDHTSCKGFFCPIGMTDKIYQWHGMLLEPRALDPSWLASRANSMTGALESAARERYRMISGWNTHVDHGWVIIDALGKMSEVETYANLGEETFVANYLLAEKHKSAVDRIFAEYEKYVFIAGTVNEVEGENEQPSDGATVAFSIGGKSYTTTTGSSGSYELLMMGKVGDAISENVSKAGFDEIKRTGGIPQRVLLGQNYTLTKGSKSLTIDGHVYDKSKSPVEPVSTATVTASSASESSLGSTTSAGDGSYTMTIIAPEGAAVTVAAVKDGAAASVAIVATGEAKSGVDLLLDMSKADTAKPATDWSIYVKVIDLDGKPVAQAAVTGGPTAVTTGGDGSAVVGPIKVIDTLGAETPEVTLTPSVTVKDGSTVGGSPVTVTFTGQSNSAVTLTLPVQTPVEVTITGVVTDANGIGVGGATVTSDQASVTTGGSGAFALPPVVMLKDQSVSVSASYTDGTNQFAGGPVTVTFSGTGMSISGVTIALNMGQRSEVTVSGRVMDSNGKPLVGASVVGGGQQATSDGGGGFTLPPFEHELGTPVEISASVVVLDGSTVSGNTSVTPKGPACGGAVITIQVQEATDEDLENAINDLMDEIDADIDWDALLAQFDIVIADLDGVAAAFNTQASYFEQRIREMANILAAGGSPCDNTNIAYALSSARSQAESYDFILSGLYGLYAELVAAQALDPADRDMALADADFNRAVEMGESINQRLTQMIGEYRSYECDEDNAEVDAGDKADEEADPDDVESGADEGGGSEICGDGIDNDGDNEIDECDAGCCDKNVQITVTDCGTAADDIFLVAVDGYDVGVTPKGAANTFNVELTPGTHTVRVTCLDDGGDPLGADIGTACVTIVVYGENIAIGGGEMAIAYGGSSDVGFNVPVGAAVPKIHQTFDGSTLKARGLEQN